MSTYAIGDVQGCRRILDRLLEEIEFSPERDQLWFAGDLVNRGPDSVGVLRFVRSLGESAVTVLGNHDLHLLACWMGVRRPKGSDTLGGVLRARDRDDLLEWLRHRPLLHHEDNHMLVHAGLAPEWTARESEKIARQVEATLRGSEGKALLQRYANKPAWPRWKPSLPRKMRELSALMYLTRVRCLRKSGMPDDDYTGTPAGAPSKLTPWYAFPGRRSSHTTILFGHWAALGVRVESRWIALDSGCAWGRSLTAVRLEDRAVFQVANSRNG